MTAPRQGGRYCEEIILSGRCRRLGSRCLMDRPVPVESGVERRALEPAVGHR
jgi:hypothetical protein